MFGGVQIAASGPFGMAFAEPCTACDYHTPMQCRWCGEVHRGGPENCGKPDARPTVVHS